MGDQEIEFCTDDDDDGRMRELDLGVAFLKRLQKRLMMASELTPCMPKYWQFFFAFLKRLQERLMIMMASELTPCMPRFCAVVNVSRLRLEDDLFNRFKSFVKALFGMALLILA